jgi:hypothetical protein
MDEGSVGLLLLFLFSVVAAVIFHLRGRGFLLASFTSAITAITALLIVDTIRRGSPDPRLAGAFVIGAGIAFLIALIVGWITRRWVSRRRKNDQANP